MNVCSIEWVGCLLLLSALFFWLENLRLRQGLLAACNGAFLATIVPDLRGWMALAMFLALGYGAALLIRHWPRKAFLAAYLTALVGLFLFLKQYAFLKAILPEALFPRAVVIVGLSYMLFRQIQVVVDLYQGQLEGLTLWTYLNYQLNLFGIVAGPIQRYQDFQHYWTELKPILTDRHSILRAYLRVFVGVIKVALIAAVCLNEFDKWSLRIARPETYGEDSHWIAMIKFLAIFYLYPAYIYFNFSGYCDIVIGGAALFGIRMPENFDRPYLSRNMIDYWTRWHRTLGFWIRDYVFTPMYKAIATRWPRRAAALAFLCYFAALFITGIWHGSTWNFVIFGLLNGVGVAAAKLWEAYLTKRFGRKGLRRYLESRTIRAVAIVATFHFVCLTILFFPPDLSRTFLIIKRGLALF